MSQGPDQPLHGPGQDAPGPVRPRRDPPAFAPADQQRYWPTDDPGYQRSRAATPQERTVRLPPPGPPPAVTSARPDSAAPAGPAATRTAGWIVLTISLVVLVATMGVALISYTTRGKDTSTQIASTQPSTATPRTSPPTPSPRPSTPPRSTTPAGPVQKVQVGQVVTLTAPALEITVGPPTFSTEPASALGSGPRNGQFGSFPVTVRNTGTDVQEISPFDFLYRGSDGTVIDVSDGSGTLSAAGSLRPSVLNPGEQVRGLLVLDIPARSGEIDYSPDLRALAVWTF